MATLTPLDSEKVTVSFPKDLLVRLRALVPARQRSAFIADAVEYKVRLLEQVEAIDESAGAWKDEDHPELRTEEDIERWLAEMRRSWDNHMVNIGAWRDDESEVSAG